MILFLHCGCRTNLLCLIFLNHSLTHWTAWLAMGHCALQTSRSPAKSQAASAVSPTSISSWRIQICRGRPRGRFHAGLSSGFCCGCFVAGSGSLMTRLVLSRTSVFQEAVVSKTSGRIISTLISESRKANFCTATYSDFFKPIYNIAWSISVSSRCTACWTGKRTSYRCAVHVWLCVTVRLLCDFRRRSKEIDAVGCGVERLHARWQRRRHDGHCRQLQNTRRRRRAMSAQEITEWKTRWDSHYSCFTVFTVSRIRARGL